MVGYVEIQETGSKGAVNEWFSYGGRTPKHSGRDVFWKIRLKKVRFLFLFCDTQCFAYQQMT
ncbi:MAG: hypothetical protein RR858_06205, partial [Mucinivorans sp.]